MSKKTGIGALLGFAAGIGTAFLVHKINKEINEMPSETGSYKEKAGKWLEIKKDNIKQAVDVRCKQITEISRKAKDALMSESSVEKRKEIINKATEQISAIKKEISDITAKGAKELSALANKISSSEMFADITEFFSSLKGETDNIVDVDYKFESEYDEYFGDDDEESAPAAEKEDEPKDGKEDTAEEDKKEDEKEDKDEK